jgi:hypothetical protein
MTTDQLVALLVADLKPVNPRRVVHAVIIALATGLVAALGATMLIFVFPPKLLDENNLELLSIKLLFASGIVATAAVFLPQLARPGARMRGNSVFALVPIPLLAILPFGALIWAVRAGAPTDRARAGAVAGLAAGGLGALACAFPCIEQSLSSIALWYGLPIGICAAVGARLGPRLLRW